MTLSSRDYALLRKFSGAPAEAEPTEAPRADQFVAAGYLTRTNFRYLGDTTDSPTVSTYQTTFQGDAAAAEYELRRRELLQMERQSRAAERALIISIISAVVSVCTMIWSIFA